MTLASRQAIVLWAVLVGVVIHFACGPSQPLPRTGAPPEPLDPSGCPAACASLRDLGCPEGQPSAAGTSCEDICARTESSGMFDLHPACVAGARSVADARACGVRCQGQ
jgi:hypothetical protein